MEIFLLPGVEGVLWANVQVSPLHLAKSFEVASEASNRTQEPGDQLGMLCPGQARTPKDGKDTHRGDRVTSKELRWVRPKASPVVLLMELLLVVPPAINCLRGFRKVRTLALSHVASGERGIFKATHHGQ